MSSSLSGFKVFVLFIFINCIFTFNTNACSYAYQYSLFLLGISGNELIFLEIEMERYINTPAGAIGIIRPDEQSLVGNSAEVETRWKGTLRLKKRTESTEFIEMEIVDYVDISDAAYKVQLAPYFEKAMQKARKLPFFEEAVLEQVAYCNYDRSCDLFFLQIDTISTNLTCGPSEEHSSHLDIRFPDIILQKFENITQLNFSEIEKVEKESRLEFFKVWRPYEARRYIIGNQSLMVYTIGWGRAKGYNATKTDNWQINRESVENFIEGNDVMMHGQRFDFIQFL